MLKTPTKKINVGCIYGKCPDCPHFYLKDAAQQGGLERDFIIPPFSLLNTMEGRWLRQKRKWMFKMGDLAATREGVLGDGQLMMSINKGVSIFDPVLTELMLKWFCPKDGVVFDPMAGDQAKGIVAGHLNYKYIGIDLRKEQVDYNNQIVKEERLKNVYFIEDNALNMDTFLPDNIFDFILSCPPYYDLEIYSTDKSDMSNYPTYKEFMKDYTDILIKSFKKLKENRFACYVVGEIRDKKTGEYRNFVGDTINAFKEAGFHYYNEFILMNSVGTLPFRTRRTFEAARKAGKQHQNILVFYKGDTTKIKANLIEQYDWNIGAPK